MLSVYDGARVRLKTVDSGQLTANSGQF